MSKLDLKQFPNIISFTWHDAGDWFGCYGHSTVNTPNVDRLAAEGTKFSNMHSACAICSPSRAALMTGKFSQNNGVMGLTNTVFNNRIHRDLPHFAAQLKALGYRTALLGVQHECAHEHVHEVLQVDEEIATDPWPGGQLLAPQVSKWLQKQKPGDGPFYAQIGTIDSHLNRFFSNKPPVDGEPYPPVSDVSKGIAQPPYLAGSEADKATVATLQGLLQRGDSVMGAVLDGLDAAGLTENTLVIMNVDHGVGLDRAKTTCFDPGTKVAWILRWPGKIPAGKTVPILATHVDFLPTVRELLGLDALPAMDGQSLTGHIVGSRDDEVHDAVYSHMVETIRSLRTNRYKFIRNFSPNKHGDPFGDCAFLHQGYATPERVYDTAHTQLYDLQNDPHERCNLVHDSAYAAVGQKLDRKLWDFLFDHNDFVLHTPCRTDFDQETRRQMEAYCAQAGRIPPKLQLTL